MKSLSSSIDGENYRRNSAFGRNVALQKLFAHTSLYLNTREEVRVLGKQLLRSGTSVAAQVREASRARSESEFVSKLGGAIQEADESLLWLELLREECRIDAGLTKQLENELSELIAIMTTMIRRTLTLTI